LKSRRYQLFAKLLGFFVSIIWLIGFLSFGSVMFSEFVDYLDAQTKSDLAKGFLEGWYMFTLVAIAVYSVYRSLRYFIGVWEREDNACK